jgi:5-histidylcysteine sulfoxide synthase/putative 4-mercaptohistidine N1-methyltranferase
VTGMNIQMIVSSIHYFFFRNKEIFEIDIVFRDLLINTKSKMATTSTCDDLLKSSVFWTGKAPVHGVCPGVDANGIIRSLPQVNLNATRQELLDYFDNAWTLTEVLFQGLANEEAFYRRPYHKLRHPMIFYYGHPAAFTVNKLRVAGLVDEPMNIEFERLFEAGVDEMRWDDLHENNDQIWPPITDVHRYRADVYRLIRNMIETHPHLDQMHMPITMDKPMWALVMTLEHERIHLETSSVLIRELPIEFVRHPSAWPPLNLKNTERDNNTENMMITMEKSVVTVGKPTDWPTFGWDNEYGNEQRPVRPFSASARLISNGQFYQFVIAGGYLQERYWSRDGWAWRAFRNVKAPVFWLPTGPSGFHQYQLRTVFEIIPMQWNWPVCINFHEAKAYCAWRTEQDNSTIPYRLLTEAEHHILRDDNEHPWNVNLRNGNEIDVDSSPPNSKGFYDVFGNVWQWCEDHFHPLHGSKPHPFYDDFSVPCYDGQHQMILGGSFVSTGDEASVWARFHFRPHFIQHAGFRLVRNEDDNRACDARLIDTSVTYESDEMLNRYLMMHWGTDSERFDASFASKITFPQVFDLPIICAQFVQRFATGTDRALDLGCAVGRTAFEVANQFKEVLGIDYSRQFIDAAQHLQRYGTLHYHRKDQGMQMTPLTAIVDPAIDRRRIRFEVGDACTLSPDLKDFDAVVFANVLCRLSTPRICLERMQGTNGLVKKGGILVMTTPLSWLPQYTPPNNWLNGIDDVAAVLTEFELIHKQELPFIIREHRRKFEYIIAQGTVWRRRQQQI